MVGQLENSKIIDIHQSFWGEVNHGHGLIATSLKDDTLNQELSSFSDRPGSTYGQSIQPYFSGKKSGIILFLLNHTLMLLPIEQV